MNKKIITTTMLCLILASSLVLAQDTSKLVNIPVDGNTFNQANEEVQTINVKFCENDAKSKQYTFFAGEKQDICLQIDSTAGKEILLSMDFVDGAVTNDQRKNKACLDNSQKTNFGQYVSGVEPSFVVPARWSIIKRATIQFPETVQWIIHGCLVYYTKEASSSWDTSAFNILVRKAKFIDIEIKKPPFNTYLLIWIVVVAMLIIFIIINKWKWVVRYRMQQPVPQVSKPWV